MVTVTVRVGFAIARPPSPRNIRFHTITHEARTEVEGDLLAAQWVASRPGVVMVTSTEIVEVEI